MGEGRLAMLRLPVHEKTRFILVRPHYPENVGASARAMKTMGFWDLALVKPGRIAVPEHMMANKMAVKSGDVLENCRQYASLAEAVRGATLVFATTSRRGVSGVHTARAAAALVQTEVDRGGSIAILFGNEKSGLCDQDLASADERLRIPMVADQPSINLAQAVQIVAYELLLTGLDARARR
jgi:tRNA (cytidine32/uridine32-2'-O)-methyltransferase